MYLGTARITHVLQLVSNEKRGLCVPCHVAHKDDTIYDSSCWWCARSPLDGMMSEKFFVLAPSRAIRVVLNFLWITHSMCRKFTAFFTAIDQSVEVLSVGRPLPRTYMHTTP